MSQTADDVRKPTLRCDSHEVKPPAYRTFVTIDLTARFDVLIENETQNCGRRGPSTRLTNLHNERKFIICTVHQIRIRMIKSVWIGWVRRAARMWDISTAHKILFGKRRVKQHSRDLVIDGLTLLKLIINTVQTCLCTSVLLQRQIRLNALFSLRVALKAGILIKDLLQENQIWEHFCPLPPAVNIYLRSASVVWFLVTRRG